MRGDNLLAAIELGIGLAMLIGFLLILLVPASLRLLVELSWAVGMPRVLPGFGLNPHWLAEARYAPSVAALTACVMLVVCYRWLTSRRRGS